MAAERAASGMAPGAAPFAPAQEQHALDRLLDERAVLFLPEPDEPPFAGPALATSDPGRGHAAPCAAADVGPPPRPRRGPGGRSTDARPAGSVKMAPRSASRPNRSRMAAVSASKTGSPGCSQTPDAPSPRRRTESRSRSSTGSASSAGNRGSSAPARSGASQKKPSRSPRASSPSSGAAFSTKRRT